MLLKKNIKRLKEFYCMKRTHLMIADLLCTLKFVIYLCFGFCCHKVISSVLDNDGVDDADRKIIVEETLQSKTPTIF